MLSKVEYGARAAFLADIRAGLFQVDAPVGADFDRIAELIETYDDLDLGMADTSVVATAERHRTERILTTDLRHFRVVRQRNGRPFVLLPWDER